MLTLILKKEWFDMIASGEKTTEYRTIKPYWTRRIARQVNAPRESSNDWKNWVGDAHFDIDKGFAPDEVLKSYYAEITQFDIVFFNHGYQKYRRQMLFYAESVDIGTGFEKWGAAPGELYYRINLADEIKRNF